MSFFSLDTYILISSFQKNSWLFWNYLSLKASEVHNWGNIENTLKIHDYKHQYYFTNISATKARIFMKFYVVVNYYLVRLSFKFHDHLCINGRARVVNARTCNKSCARTDRHEISNLNSQDNNWPPHKIKIRAFVTKIFVKQYWCL